MSELRLWRIRPDTCGFRGQRWTEKRSMAGRCLGCAAEIVARCSSSSQSPEMTFEKSNSRSKLAKGGSARSTGGKAPSMMHSWSRFWWFVPQGYSVKCSRERSGATDSSPFRPAIHACLPGPHPRQRRKGNGAIRRSRQQSLDRQSEWRAAATRVRLGSKASRRRTLYRHRYPGTR